MVTMTTDFAAENQFINARDTYERREGVKLPFPEQVALEWLQEFFPRGPWTVELIGKAHRYYVGRIEGPDDLARMWLDTSFTGTPIVVDGTHVDYTAWPWWRIPEGERIHPAPSATWAEAPYNTIDWPELSLDVLNVIQHNREGMKLRVYGDGHVFQKPLHPQV